MATRSAVFNNFTSVADQQILNDLVVEAVQIYGHDVNYLVRNAGNQDLIYFEDTISDFPSALPVEMYIMSVEGFEGEMDFLSKFSIEIPNQLKLAVARSSFINLVGTASSISRPREGDLVHLPVNNDMFQITFVEDEQPFNQLGAKQFYVITLEKFSYSHEVFATGVPAIDNYFAVIDELDEDPFASNDAIEAEADAIIDFSEINPFGDNF